MHKNEGPNQDTTTIAGTNIAKTSPLPATTINKDYWNAMGQEIENVIRDAGMSLVGSAAADQASGWIQLTAAIKTHANNRFAALFNSAFDTRFGSSLETGVNGLIAGDYDTRLALENHIVDYLTDNFSAEWFNPSFDTRFASVFLTTLNTAIFTEVSTQDIVNALADAVAQAAIDNRNVSANIQIDFRDGSAGFGTAYAGASNKTARYSIRDNVRHFKIPEQTLTIGASDRNIRITGVGGIALQTGLDLDDTSSVTYQVPIQISVNGVEEMGSVRASNVSGALAIWRPNDEPLFPASATVIIFGQSLTYFT